jgi:hypothetical protein
MAWGTPLTAVANSPLNAAQWNSSVRDNLNETAAAKATTAGSIFVGTGVNTLAERLILSHSVDTSETTTSTTYTSLATNGPVVTAITGTQALVFTNAQLMNSGAGASIATYEVTGATTDASDINRSLIVDNLPTNSVRMGSCNLQTGLTPGSNTFRILYRVVSGTGTFQRRRLQVMAL